ncbi:MAG: sugar phosphate isomerase/epimerase, partial [Proteobacteria bacterium]|nr:sugar phosphate isomerase/epimerase [Pseudomonadota bacterium]
VGDATFPSPRECQGLARIKREQQLSYSLHTPLDVSLASSDERRRRESVVAVRRAIEVAVPFAPEVYIVHVYLGEREHDAHVPTDLCAWRRRAARSLEELLALGLASRDLCVESLDYDLRLLEPVLEDLDISVALDVGHLLRDGRDESEVLERHLHRTRVIQWHGVTAAGKDHRSLRHYPRARAQGLLEVLTRANYQGVLTLEVFTEHDLEESKAEGELRHPI